MNTSHGAYAPGAPGPFSRGMALFIYALLFFGLPTFGTSALVGLVLAYARRDGSPPLIRSHHRFQIRLFWLGVAMTAAALVLAGGAFADAARLPPPPVHVPVSPHATLVSWSPDQATPVAQSADIQTFTYRFGSRALQWRTRALLEGYGAAVLGGFAVLWAFLAPLYGAARLASGRAMGQSAVATSEAS